MQIPIIDFHPFIVGDTVAKEAVADQISRAIHEIGCFYIKNSGLPNNLISQVFAQIKWFFALPQEEKNQIPMVADGTSRGYIAQWKEELLNESFIFSKEIFIDEVGVGSYAIEAPNHWLKGQPEFREVLWQSYSACHDVTTILLQALAIALKLPESYFTDLHSEQNHNALLHHYPSLVQPPKPGQTRFDEHSDLGSISLLFQDETGGLQVCTTSGEWIAAPSIPDTVLVIVADLIQRWTNDKFRATKHQVPLPAEFHSANQRYSFAFFASPNNDAEITCIESCLDPGELPKYPPITTNEYFNQKSGK